MLKLPGCTSQEGKVEKVFEQRTQKSQINFMLTVILVLSSVFLGLGPTIAFLFVATAWQLSTVYVHLTAVK